MNDAIKRIYTPQSSQITCYRYDPESKVLEVTFNSTATTYHYYDVPQSTVDGLKSAESKGRFFGQNIKWKFRYEKQTTAPPPPPPPPVVSSMI